jgi:predicted PurR-regulated permease PerM
VDQIIYAVQQFGFPIVIAVGLGYFVYYVWRTIIKVINPAIKSMHMGLIKLIDQIRMLDNDMIRLQEKVDTVLQIKENEKINRSSNTISRNKRDSR